MGKPVGYSDLENRVILLEGKMDNEFKLISIRLGNAEQSDQRFELSQRELTGRLTEIEKNQKDGTAIMIEMSQQLKQIYEIFDFDGSKESFKHNRKVWEKINDGVNRTDSFKKKGFDVFATWFWRSLIIVIAAGMGYIITHER